MPSTGTLQSRSTMSNPRSHSNAIAGAAAPTPGNTMRSASTSSSASREMTAATPSRSSA